LFRTRKKGALLRREGIYSSYIATWKRQLERGKLAGSDDKKRGPKADSNQEELERLKKENECLREQLRQSELIIEAQKKSHRYLVWKKKRKTRANDQRSKSV